MVIYEFEQRQIDINFLCAIFDRIITKASTHVFSSCTTIQYITVGLFLCLIRKWLNNEPFSI